MDDERLGGNVYRVRAGRVWGIFGRERVAGVSIGRFAATQRPACARVEWDSSS